MNLLFLVIISFVLLLVSAIKDFFIVAPLLASMVILMTVLLKRGFTLKRLIEMAVIGSQKYFSLLAILLLISTLMAVWMAGGTVPLLVYWGIKSIYPQYFIFGAFILTSIIAVLLGTSFGTVSTRGFKRLSYFGKGSKIFSP